MGVYIQFNVSKVFDILSLNEFFKFYRSFNIHKHRFFYHLKSVNREQ